MAGKDFGSNEYLSPLANELIDVECLVYTPSPGSFVLF